MDSASDPRIPPQDFRPLLSGTLHTTKAEEEAEVFTSTSTIDELTIHGHGSLRNYSSVHKSDSEGLVSYAVNYDITQIVRDPVVLEGFNHQLVLFGDLMLGSGVANPGNPKEINLISGTYEAQIRTPETIIYGDEKSPISGAYTFNLVSHNISAEIRYLTDGYDVTYTNNGETQTKTVQF